MGYIKQMIIDRRFQGQKFPENIVFLAACNPHRKIDHFSQGKELGLKMIEDNKSNKLAFQVKIPPLSAIAIMWDYGQLKPYQTQKYISKMLEPINTEKKQKVVQTLVKTH